MEEAVYVLVNPTISHNIECAEGFITCKVEGFRNITCEWKSVINVFVKDIQIPFFNCKKYKYITKHFQCIALI